MTKPPDHTGGQDSRGEPRGSIPREASKVALPYLITEDLYIDEYLTFNKPQVVTRWMRVKLWLRALCMQVRAFSYTSDENVKIKGWIANDGTIYVTRIKLPTL